MTDTAKPPAQTNAKKPKRKGPVRWEAVLPAAIAVGLIATYSALFLDLHLRLALESLGSRAVGAEVNVASLRTSFWRASLQIDDVQVTDPDAPATNMVRIGRIRWQMLWDALLRGKIAIADATIEGIALGVPRRSPGFVLPKPPPPKESAFDKLKERALVEAQKEFDQNILGDVAALLKGGDPAAQLGSLQANLKSSLRIKELEAELGRKQKEWKERLDKLPQQKELQAFEARLKKIKLGGFANPAEAQQSLQEIGSILNDASAKANEVKSTGESLNKDVSAYQNSLKDLEAMVKADVKDLESRLKIPKLDPQSLSRMLFGPQLMSKVRKAESYMNMARKHIPPKKTREQLQAEKAEKAAQLSTPRERAKGRTYAFGRPSSYPMFWLKHASIGSKASPGGLSGDVRGVLLNVTNDQTATGQPTVAMLEGDFPVQEIRAARAQLTIDHRSENPVEKLHGNVGRFVAAGKKLVDSPDVQLGFERATGSTELKAELSGPRISLDVRGAFGDIGYLVGAKEPMLADILKAAVAEVPEVTYQASATGEWSSPAFAIDTNLGRELAKALEKQIQAKIAAARAQLQKLIDERIGQEKAKLFAEYKKVQDQVQSLVKSKEAEIEKAKRQLETAKNDAIKGQTKGLEDQGKKAVDDLKKKFGF